MREKYEPHNFMKNTGLIIPEIETKEEGAEHLLGSIERFKGAIINHSGNWLAFQPLEEVQAKRNVDVQGCVSFGTLNAIETLEYKLTGVRPNYSDRALAILSGTTRAGNDPHKVCEAIRKYGLVPEEMLPFEESMTWDEYYTISEEKRKEIEKEGQKWLDKWDFAHEWLWSKGVPVSEKVKRIREALTKGTIGLSVYGWMKDENGNYYKPNGVTDNHWAMGIVPDSEFTKTTVFDSYDPFLKKLVEDYDCSIGKVFYLRLLPPGERQKNLSLFAKILQGFLDLLKSFMSVRDKEIEHEKPEEQRVSRIKDWAKLIESCEGYGSANAVTITKNFNPGAIKGLDGKFLSFPSYEAGFAYLCDYLTRACTGKHPAYPNGGETTLFDFTKIYVGNDRNYASEIASGLGVSPLLSIGNLL